jgi:ATP:ADP antiporter, AAA family
MIYYQDAIRYFLRKTFDLREGEISRAALMQLNIFLIICTLLIVKPVAKSLLSSEYGPQSLPIAFVLVALSAAIVSTFYSRMLGKVPLNKIIIWSLVISVFTLILLGVLLSLHLLAGWIYYFLYIFVAIFAALATSQFWIMANVVFNAREAKRLFGFIGAGAIAGGIVGGYLTSALTQFMSIESLLFVAAALVACCIPITRHIWITNVAPNHERIEQKKRIGVGQEHPLKLILNSRHLTYMAVIIGVSVMVAKLIEYQFNALATDYYTDPVTKITDKEALTSFFGVMFSTLNIISLLVQLLVTHRVVGVFGVGASLFFLPGGILLGALLLLLFPALWAAVFINIADGSLKQSINKSATELLALPIPNDIKNRTKSFIDL